MLQSHSTRSAQSGFVPISTLLFLLFVLVCATAALGRWPVFWALASLWSLAFLLIGCGVLPRMISASLQRGFVVAPISTPTSSSAIIMLGAGTSAQAAPGLPLPAWESHSRIEKTAQLYLAAKRTGFPCTVIIAGGDVSRSAVTSSPVYSPRLLSLGVDPLDLVLENVGVNSFQHAKFTKALLDQRSCDQVFLVTSGLHLKRALLYFAHFDVHPIPVSSDYVTGVISPLPIGFNFAVMEIAWHQYVGIARLHVYNALGWN